MAAFSVDRYLGVLPVLAFLPKRQLYYASRRRATPVTAEFREHFETLKRDGVVIIPNFVDRATAAAMLERVPGDADRFEQSPEGDQALFIPNAHTLPGFEVFFDNAVIKNVVTSYIGEDAVPLRRSIEWRRTHGQIITFDRMYHVDTWKYRVKAFLYLHDVGPDDAPMTYVRKSHRGRWRLPMEARIASGYKVDDRGYAANEDLAYIGCYWPYEVDELRRTRGMSDVVCTGKAGTLVIFDARGIHRATELKSACRKILISYWVCAGHHT